MSNYRTAAATHDFVFVAFGRHVVAMDRATGRRVWQQEMSAPRTIRIAVVGTRVFALGTDLICFDATNGSVLWQSTDAPGDTLLADGDGVFTGGIGEVSCFDAATGKRRWHDRFKGMGIGGVALAVEGASSQDDLTG